MKKSASTTNNPKNKYTTKNKSYKQTHNTLSQESSFFAFPYTNSQNETQYQFETANEEDLFIHSPVYTFHERQKPLTWCYSITPIHLRNLEIICKIFGRSRYTVKQWVKEGAPIVYDGVSYISEYNALFSWLLNYYKDNVWQ